MHTLYTYLSVQTNCMNKLLQKLIQTPRKVFLLDGVGAILSTSALVCILLFFQELFGMPYTTIIGLVMIAFTLIIYSFTCYFINVKPQKTAILLVAIANLIYCLLTLSLVLIHYSMLSTLAVIYFVAEIVIILLIVRLELLVQKSLS